MFAGPFHNIRIALRLPSLPPIRASFGLRVGFLILLNCSAPDALARTKHPAEYVILREAASHMRLYAYENNGLWPTNWTQFTNSTLAGPTYLLGARIQVYLPELYLFLPHQSPLTWKRHGATFHVVMIRAEPKKERHDKSPGRDLVQYLFPPTNPKLPEFEVDWISESQLQHLLAQQRITLPKLDVNDEVVSRRRHIRRERITKVAVSSIVALGGITLWFTVRRTRTNNRMPA